MEFCWNFGFQISQFFLKKNHSFVEFFDKISNPHNKTTLKFYNFFENHRQVKYKKKCQKKLKNWKSKEWSMEFWKCFVFKISLIFLTKIQEFSRILWSNL